MVLHESQVGEVKVRYAIIENNIVKNIAIADEAFAFSQGWILCEGFVSIGWEYVDGTFKKPLKTDIEETTDSVQSSVLGET